MTRTEMVTPRNKSQSLYQVVSRLSMTRQERFVFRANTSNNITVCHTPHYTYLRVSLGHLAKIWGILAFFLLSKIASRNLELVVLFTTSIVGPPGRRSCSGVCPSQRLSFVSFVEVSCLESRYGICKCLERQAIVVISCFFFNTLC